MRIEYLPWHTINAAVTYLSELEWKTSALHAINLQSNVKPKSRPEIKLLAMFKPSFSTYILVSSKADTLTYNDAYQWHRASMWVD